MRYLVIDANPHGTGIRDGYEGGYIDPDTLGLTADIVHKIQGWLIRYESEHYNGYTNDELVNQLDEEGKEIALEIGKQSGEAKISYYSDARLTKEAMYPRSVNICKA